MKMRVLYLYSSLAQWGGVERILSDKMNWLVREYGYEVYMVTSDQGEHPVPYPLDERIHLQDLDVRFHLQYRFRGLKRFRERRRLDRLYLSRLQRAIRQIKPDVVICTTAHDVRGLLRIKGDVPLIVECHVNFSHPDSFVRRIQSLINNCWIGKADAVVTLTDGDARRWRRVSRHVHVIPNLAHLNDTGHHSDHTAKRAIFVGRFTAQKGIEDLFRIWELVHQSAPDWRLDVFGEGELWEHYRRQAEEQAIGIYIHRPTADIMEEYLQSSMLLVTSVYEPFGLVIPEAMSCGLPVVAFDCPYGPADIIKDGDNGFLIGRRDPVAFANAVLVLVKDSDLRRRLGDEATLTARHFSQEQIMPQWKRLLEGLIG